ncbi:hypothetical protein BS50DRAFT_25211 [Corynespora cassiicola Philippines]|uniref:Uncharacterized protein n=1 Tax=Corynespora cassiicola Philippines TaxID=1448308 RepID=A0A2T2PAZ1_CORCC|nr:hypothetical protein BS50DRAFT_25211 [Corynespora cassiicola Philippines]
MPAPPLAATAYMSDLSRREGPHLASPHSAQWAQPALITNCMHAAHDSGLHAGERHRVVATVRSGPVAASPPLLESPHCQYSRASPYPLRARLLARAGGHLSRCRGLMGMSALHALPSARPPNGRLSFVGSQIPLAASTLSVAERKPSTRDNHEPRAAIHADSDFVLLLGCGAERCGAERSLRLGAVVPFRSEKGSRTEI